MMGLEPTTLGTTNRCSNQLSYIYRFGDCKNRNLRPICKEFFYEQSGDVGRLFRIYAVNYLTNQLNQPLT